MPESEGISFPSLDLSKPLNDQNVDYSDFSTRTPINDHLLICTNDPDRKFFVPLHFLTVCTQYFNTADIVNDPDFTFTIDDVKAVDFLAFLRCLIPCPLRAAVTSENVVAVAGVSSRLGCWDLLKTCETVIGNTILTDLQLSLLIRQLYRPVATSRPWLFNNLINVAAKQLSVEQFDNFEEVSSEVTLMLYRVYVNNSQWKRKPDSDSSRGTSSVKNAGSNVVAAMQNNASTTQRNTREVYPVPVISLSSCSSRNSSPAITIPSRPDSRLHSIENDENSIREIEEPEKDDSSAAHPINDPHPAAQLDSSETASSARDRPLSLSDILVGLRTNGTTGTGASAEDNSSRLSSEHSDLIASETDRVALVSKTDDSNAAETETRDLSAMVCDSSTRSLDSHGLHDLQGNWSDQSITMDVPNIKCEPQSGLEGVHEAADHEMDVNEAIYPRAGGETVDARLALLFSAAKQESTTDLPDCDLLNITSLPDTQSVEADWKAAISDENATIRNVRSQRQRRKPQRFEELRPPVKKHQKKMADNKASTMPPWKHPGFQLFYDEYKKIHASLHENRPGVAKNKCIAKWKKLNKSAKESYKTRWLDIKRMGHESRGALKNK